METTHRRKPLSTGVKFALWPPGLVFVGSGVFLFAVASWNTGLAMLGLITLASGALLAFVGLPLAIKAARSRKPGEPGVAIWLGLLGNGSLNTARAARDAGGFQDQQVVTRLYGRSGRRQASGVDEAVAGHML